mmetsp:Transcript_16714/g.27019  ORF Transcript_16714/g.27019 Transcript_16714/m.27019 type:complete len:80 (-) Transcript_16714:360-599(-)
MAKDHCTSMNELGSVFKQVGEYFPNLYVDVNIGHMLLLNWDKNDIKTLQLEKEKLDLMLGDVECLANAHGYAAEGRRDP